MLQLYQETELQSQINGDNITIGTIANERLDADLQDLADGSIALPVCGLGTLASQDSNNVDMHLEI